ncbi:NAD(P)H-quinone oxidoreductase subunit N [filamentous cyanobacterium LEGE 11480]|uniref:NAD(P)H-quinone oxidoreductase subunit N n=1 Tax=Romeriopsis navalis LEGE 11480 TaxID=2777977 RepID=A0A928VV30_9CYAN|nr:NAD(P)H-quinone oxidoreductase subunit N [Romeriopsis navalis]MBE9032589.1 NAD(P)H-quinone oxidoreductase subunit N [Romeriopsis navalis LEGE 11480]
MFSLITTGGKFIKDVETHGAVAVYAPLEGGYEGRYLRRMRAKGYEALSISARGLGDLQAYLMDVHGVRPPHLGKKSKSSDACVGSVYYVPPIVGTQLDNLSPRRKGLILWIVEGFVLTNEELNYLKDLAKSEPRLKIVIEMGGERYFRWQPLVQSIAA